MGEQIAKKIDDVLNFASNGLDEKDREFLDGCKNTQSRDGKSGRLAYLVDSTSTLNLGAMYDASESRLITQTAKIQNFSVVKTTADFTNLPYGGTVLMDSGTMTLHSGSIIQNSTTEFLPNGNLVAPSGSNNHTCVADYGGSAIFAGNASIVNINSGATIYNCQNII